MAEEPWLSVECPTCKAAPGHQCHVIDRICDWGKVTYSLPCSTRLAAVGYELNGFSIRRRDP